MALKCRMRLSQSLGGKLGCLTPEMSTRRSPRNHTASAVLCSQENKMCDNSKDLSKPRKMCRKAHSLGSHSDSDTGAYSPVLHLVKRGVQDTQKLRETNVWVRAKNNRKRSTRSALKIYDYSGSDPETENMPKETLKKKSPACLKANRKIRSVEDHLKHKRMGHKCPTAHAKNRNGMSSSHFENKENARVCKSQNKTHLSNTVKADINVNNTTAENVSASDQNTSAGKSKLAVVASVAQNEKKLPSSSLENSCDNAVRPTAPVNITDVLAGAAKIMHSVTVDAKTTTECIASSDLDHESSTSYDKDDSEIILNFAKQQENSCSETQVENEDSCGGEDDAKIPIETVPFGVTSTPEKNDDSQMPYEYSFFMDSSVNESMEVTLYDSPEELSPIKNVPSPASSVSSNSCGFDEFSSSQNEVLEISHATPAKTYTMGSVMRSAKAYHTRHEFRRHLFKQKDKKAQRKRKSHLEVKLDMWASLMNSHFEEIEDSELLIE